MTSRALLFAPLLLLAGCEPAGPCTASVEPGLVVRVLDDLTGLPAATGATAIAVDGDYEETLRNPMPEDPDAELLYGADEREGTYVVSIAKPGYAQWVRAGVRVTADECHVRTVNLEARLQPFR